MSDIVIKINNEDVTSYVYNLSRLPIYSRNYDFSQVFTAINFTLSYKYKKHGLIKENETIVEAFIDDNCVYTGYVESATVNGYYQKKIRVQHITQKLKTIKALEDAKDITGVYQLRPEFDFAGDTLTCSELLRAIMQMIGYTSSGANNYINEAGELNGILSNNQILNNIKYWSQDAEYNEDEDKVYFSLDPSKSPSMWDLLVLLQKVFHFSCRFKSLYSSSKHANIITAGHFYAQSFADLPAQGGVDPSFIGLRDKITIINENLLSDIPSRKAVKKESNSINNEYIDILLYTDPSTSTKPEEIKTEKSYEAVKFTEKKIAFPEHFVFTADGLPDLKDVPFVLQTEFIPYQESFILKQQPVSIYSRWMNYCDYAQIGVYIAGFEKAAENYYSAKYYLYGWDDQLLTKLPRRIDYNIKNKIFEITQDEPERY